MLGFLGQLTPRQRQVLAALTSCLVLLGLALGVVALGDPGDGGEEAVQTEAGASTSTTADDPVASVPVDGTSTSDPGADDEDAGEDDGAPRRATSSTAAGGKRGATTSSTRGSTSGTGGPGDGGPSTTGTVAAPSTTTTTTGSGGTGCTTTGSGGAAAELARRYCDHRAANGATARMERSSRLDAAAAAWAQELVARNALAHGPYAAAVREVCPTCTPGENVAYWDVPNVPSTWSGWLASPPHRANLDKAAGGYYGTGSAEVAPGGRTFYVHVFAWFP